jgi:hypothetical protein
MVIAGVVDDAEHARRRTAPPMAAVPRAALVFKAPC